VTLLLQNSSQLLSESQEPRLVRSVNEHRELF